MTEKTHEAVAVIERSAVPERVHPLVAIAMQGGQVDPQTLKDLLAVQREWEAAEARKAYTAALVDLKRDLPTVIKRDTRVDFSTSKGRVSYTHTSLAGVMDAITEPLARHGFSVAWTPRTEAEMVYVTCRLTHSGGHHEETTINAPLDKSGLKSQAQGIASTITLLQRYTVLALLGIATADMQEPTPHVEEQQTAVDASANLKIAKLIVDAGKTVQQAEAHLGSSIRRWTQEDVAKVHAWLEKETTPSPKLASALEVIAKAETQNELQALVGSLKALGLDDYELAMARQAFRARKSVLSHPATTPEQQEFTDVGPPALTDEEAAEMGEVDNG